MRTEDDPRLINLTPHPVVVLDSQDRPVATYPSAGEARAEALREKVDAVTVGADVFFGAVTGLPMPQAGTALIVSRVAAEAARSEGRSTDDLLIPHDLLRGPDGQPIGCHGFATL